ncbi:MAG TPA: hypothetical protein GX527_02645 [Clostridiaceae bacterium]|nr:hypothetical protein [Clostridiaceae bacterium]
MWQNIEKALELIILFADHSIGGGIELGTLLKLIGCTDIDDNKKESVKKPDSRQLFIKLKICNQCPSKH